MSDILRDTLLHLESIGESSFIRSRPDAKIVFDANKLRGDAKPVSHALDTASEDVGDIQLLSND